MRKVPWIVAGIVATVGIAATVVGAIFLFGWPAGGDGVLASLRLADGSEYMLTQRNNHSVEPFTVSFYMRPSPNAPWGWCYVDHETPRWRRVAMAYNAASDTVFVTEQGVRRTALDRRHGTFWIDNGSIERTLPAPQENGRDPGFPFPGT